MPSLFLSNLFIIEAAYDGDIFMLFIKKTANYLVLTSPVFPLSRILKAYFDCFSIDFFAIRSVDFIFFSSTP